MRLLSFRVSIFLFFSILWASSSLMGQDLADNTVLESAAVVDYQKKREDKMRSRWEKLIPTYSKIQFAGAMGLISVGTGWDYGKNKQWETDLFFGIVPKYSTEQNKVTMTVRQNFIPWTVPLSRSFFLKLFSTGLYINTVFGEDFWRAAPSKYPNKYYQFSTKMRLNIFVGQGLEYRFDSNRDVFCKSLTFFYQIHTNELYLMSSIPNKYLKPTDIIGLSLGLKVQFL